MVKNQKLSPSFESIAIGLYRAGIKVDIIAERLEVGRAAIYGALHRNGIDLPSHRKRVERILTPEREAELVARYVQDLIPITQLEKEFGVSGNIIYRRLKEAGVERNHFAGPKTHFQKYVLPNGRLCRFRSRWEKVYATYLDERQLDWAYESHTFGLSDGTVYTPDFWIPSWNLFVEVKGRMTNEAQRKIDLFRSEYPSRRLLIVDRAMFASLKIKLSA